jgi:hypothetical protein
MHAIGDSRNSIAQINKQAPRTWTKAFTSVKAKAFNLKKNIKHNKVTQTYSQRQGIQL